MITTRDIQKAEGRRHKILEEGMPRTRAFTLIETLVAISLLTIAIVAPMSLTTQSLASAYYARDQITASYLAQEAIEGVREVRDGNILQNSQGTSVDLLAGIPSTSGQPFTVDTRNTSVPPSYGMSLCTGQAQGTPPVATCSPLQLDPTGTFYGYGSGTDSQFTRTVTTCFIQPDGTCSGNTVTDEIRVTATVSWKTGGLQVRTITLTENLYRWVNDGSGSST